MLPRDMHLGIIEVRNAEADFGMKKNTLYSGFLTGLSWFLFTHCGIGTPQYTLTCFCGTVLSVLWIAVTLRTKQLMTAWNNSLAHLEILDGDVTSPRVFAGKDFQELERKRITRHFILLILIASIGGIWLWLANRSIRERSHELKTFHGGYSHVFIR
jgi:hypothetical protein